MADRRILARSTAVNATSPCRQRGLALLGWMAAVAVSGCLVGACGADGTGAPDGGAPVDATPTDAPGPSPQVGGWLAAACGPADGAALDLLLVGLDGGAEAAECTNPPEGALLVLFIGGTQPEDQLPSGPFRAEVGDRFFSVMRCPSRQIPYQGCVAATAGTLELDSYDRGTSATGTFDFTFEDSRATGELAVGFCVAGEPLRCG